MADFRPAAHVFLPVEGSRAGIVFFFLGAGFFVRAVEGGVSVFFLGCAALVSFFFILSKTHGAKPIHCTP